MVTFSHLGKVGWFGNQLFEYAGTTLYARRFGYEVCMPDWIGTKVFDGVRPWASKEKFRSHFVPIKRLVDLNTYNRWDRVKYTLGFTKSLPELHSMEDLYKIGGDNIDFLGYMQDPLSFKLLEEKKDEVLKLFTFKQEIEEKVRDTTKEFGPYVALHLRRGDFVRLGLALPSSYYHDVVPKLLNGRPLFVASNDPEIEKELGGFAGVNIIKPKNPIPELPDFIFDFLMIKNADTVVGCGSTFSWWAAYLGNKNSFYGPPLTHLWQKGVAPSMEKLSI